LITFYGALLRFEALAGGYGHQGQPRWGQALEHRLVPLARALHPQAIVWPPVAEPYVGGDPINYIRYARDMRHFYQAHVREPMFLAATKLFLWLTGGRDIAVSYASAASATLAIFATYLLGAAMWSRAVGLAAAFALAIETQAIAWSVEGWRDDTFMLFVTLTTWSLVRLHQQPDRRTGLVAGICAAAACLTRISALSFVVPALAWIALAPPARPRGTARPAAIAALTCGLLVAPYMINCWRTFGDPLYALNYHTLYYRQVEGLPPDESVGALEYARTKLSARPIATIDTGLQGLVTVPFYNKWHGWGTWSGAIGPVLRVCGGIGLLAALWFPLGRLILLIVFTSLAPYALTWSVGGGGEWRFTQHVYPIYLTLACAVPAAAWTFAASSVRSRRILVTRAQLVRVAATLALLTVGCVAFWLAPLLVVREALAAGDAVTIAASDRNRYFFMGRWSDPIDYGNVIVRVAEAEIVSVRLPLPDESYAMTLRVDPALTADPARQPRVTVFFNRRPLAELDLTRDPDRMGSYRLEVPKELVRPWSRLDLMASHTVAARDAGDPFEAVQPDRPVAFRFWYVRLEALRSH
jgi:hypothetical protein